jgi:hypothetical protein
MTAREALLNFLEVAQLPYSAYPPDESLEGERSKVVFGDNDFVAVFYPDGSLDMFIGVRYSDNDARLGVPLDLLG